MDATSRPSAPEAPPPPDHGMDKVLVKGIAWTGAAKYLTQVLRWASTILVANLLTPGDYGIFMMALPFLGLALAWNLRRFQDHVGDVHDPGELLALAEREIMAPLDVEARRLVTRAAKRVATVTALSPVPAIAVGYVLVENLRLLRMLATLYGARPGYAGAARLARMVLGHIVATGGVAMTDDLIGQFLGQDLIRRLSRRLGEGAFNGALTARIGVTALEVVRPMPFRIARPPRLRDVAAEALKPLLGRG